jgi:hypothetical protein
LLEEFGIDTQEISIEIDVIELNNI